jgi:hypothetical protein
MTVRRQAGPGALMGFVDFSDAEDMLELLVEYVTDECSGAEDPQRRRFLSGLLESVTQLQEGAATMSAAERIECLRDLHASVDPEFGADPVVQHLQDCAAELTRLGERR